MRQLALSFDSSTYTLQKAELSSPMRYLVFTFISLFLIQGTTAQVIARLSGGTSYFCYLPPLGTDDLHGVVSVAAPNDTIILPGGMDTHLTMESP